MNNSKHLIANYFLQAELNLKNLQINEIERVVLAINSVRQSNNVVYIAGNGGSASTASHFATDIGVGSLSRANPIRTISLCDNTAAITAIANDSNYSLIFENQLKLLGNQGDMFIAISASGNSENLIKAVNLAKAIGVDSYSLTGFDGGKLRHLTQGRNIHVETPIGTYGLVEDAHLAICHVITDCLRSLQ